MFKRLLYYVFEAQGFVATICLFPPPPSSFFSFVSGWWIYFLTARAVYLLKPFFLDGCFVRSAIKLNNLELLNKK